MRQTFINTAKFILILLGLNISQVKAQSNDLQILETEYNHSGQLFSIIPHPSWSKTPMDQLPSLLAKAYGISPNFTFKEREVVEEEKYTFTKVYQMIGKYQVLEGDMIFKRDKSGSLQVILGIPRDPASIAAPVKTGDQALAIALETIQKSKDDYFISDKLPVQPKIELKYASIGGIQTNKVTLCYEVMIATKEPAVWYLYVNAVTGNVEYYYNGLPSSNGTGTTLYSGTKNINTTKIAGGYSLVDSVRKIQIFNYRNIANTNFNSPNGGYLVTDPDNNFDSSDQKYAIDAHWGLAVTYDYYLNVHGRKSYDGKGSLLQGNVRWDADLNNSFFSPATNQMYFGKGDGTFLSDFVSLDCVGHEYSHSLINASANLTYRGESGALNESFADIFGHCIEAAGKGVNWALFEDCFTPGVPGDAMRNMDDPNKSGNNGNEIWLHCPDTYKGDHWKSTSAGYDDGGVHFNSGVQNYWFYLLTDGGSGTNDAPFNDAFSVTGIGQTKSEKIAFRALTMYLAPSSDFRASRKATLLAAEDLYGKTSNEYKQVCNAWYAVGVGEKCCDTMELEFTVTDTKCPDGKDGEIDLTVKKAQGPFTFRWFKGDTTSAELSTNEDITGLDTGRYIVIVKDTVAKCEVVDKTNVKSPDPLEVSISGGGIFVGACQSSFTVTLTASASGGTPPYDYNWPGGIQEITMSGGAGFTNTYTVNAKDDNNCQDDESAVVTYVPIVCSYDPNEIVGPASYGDQKWVSVKATLPYKIRYENDPKFATGPAQRVTIDHKLDTNTDLNSFRLGNFGFYKYDFSVPNNTTSYTKRLDLRDSFGIYLDVVAGLDVAQRKAFWIFESIDPATGLPPTAGNSGFLAINDSTKHNGEGYVNYTIRPKKKAITGDSIRAEATIIFDDNPDVKTPRIHNLIDAYAPASEVDSIPPFVDSDLIDLKLNGNDDAGGSGLAYFDIYVSENSAAYNLLASAISDSVYKLNANFGSSYRAFAISTDNTGNRETSKKTPDVSFTVASAQFFKSIPPNTSLCAGDTLNIEWYASAFPSIDFEYSADSGQSYTTLATGINGQDTLYRWEIPSSISGVKDYFIRASASSNVIDSSEYFELKQGPMVNLGPDTAFCDYASFSLVLNPGSGFAAYKWSDSSSNPTLTVSNYGDYWVRVTAANGCSASEMISVTKNLLPQVSNKDVELPECYGDNTGSIDLTVVSGTAPYSYLWNNSQTTQDLSGLLAGFYKVTITDTKGCQIKDSTDINQPSALTSSKTKVDVLCYGNATGSIDLTVAGGTPGYTYAWTASNGGIVPSGQSGIQDLTGLVAGTYDVTVTDANGCTTTNSATISQPSAALNSSKTQVDVLCHGNATGSIDLTVSGGTPGYTYLWTATNGGVVPSGQSGNQDLTGLVAGTYEVTVTDANGCTTSNSATISQPSGALSSSKTQVNVFCYGNATGSIDLTVNNGTPGYTYSWTASNGGAVPSGQAGNQDLTDLIAGTYDVTVTDANGCTAANSATINQPSAALSGSTSQVNVVCYGNATGSIDLTASGGTMLYSYSWSAGGGGVVPSGQSGNEDLSGLVGGDYMVTITDANGCVLKDTVTITQPSSGLSSTKTQIDIKCNGDATGSIDLTVSGGTPAYTYVWTASNGGSIPSGQSTNQDLTDLIAGTYDVVISDNGGSCTASNSVTITEPTVLSSSKTQVDVLCHGDASGSIDLAVSGGTPGYTYLWTASNGGVVPSGQSGNQDLTGLVAGTYDVTVTDDNGCTTTNSATISQPTAVLNSSKTQVDVLCHGDASGSIDLAVSGGTPGYIYLWTASNGGVVPSGQSGNQDLTGLVAGTYDVTITDANGCTTANSATINQPSAALSSSKTQVNVLCYGNATGSIDLTVNGGTPGYTYSWTASNGGVVPSGQVGNQDLTGLLAGTYDVTVTDANGCTTANSATISQPSAALSSSKTQVNTTPGGSTGSIDLAVTGGTPGYTYSWTASSGGVVPSGQSGNQDLTGLVEGNYSVTVTDANGCTTNNSATITSSGCGAGNPSGVNTFTGNKTISTQAQMDAFYSTVSGANYGNKWSKVDGNLTIDGSSSTDPITSLCNLSSLTEITGNLYIYKFTKSANPTNLDKLSSLENIGCRLEVRYNTQLTGINLTGLKKVGCTILLMDNSVATSIAMPALETMSGEIINITNNPKLETLNISTSASSFKFTGSTNNCLRIVDNGGTASGSLSVNFQKLKRVKGYLYFINNDNSGVSNFDNIFSGLDTVNGKLTITNNNYLAKCCIAASAVVQGTRTISGNTGNCADLSAVASDCGSFHKKSGDFEPIIENNELIISVYPSPNKGRFDIDLITNDMGTVKVSVIDAVGRTIYSQSQTVSGFLNIPINLDFAAKGQYLVKAEMNGQIILKRVMIAE